MVVLTSDCCTPYIHVGFCMTDMELIDTHLSFGGYLFIIQTYHLAIVTSTPTPVAPDLGE